MTDTTPRYLELVGSIPGGSFYASQGHVLPVQDAPYVLVFTDATAPNGQWRINVDGQSAGTTDSDADGIALVTVTLAPGEHIVGLEQVVGAGVPKRHTAYVTTRHWATWLAAYAEMFEGGSGVVGGSGLLGLDEASESVLSGTRLASADNRHIQEAHGALLRAPNAVGYVLESYRKMLQGFRQAYRLWGGKLSGVRQVVSEVTGVLPWRVPRDWRPRWVADGGYLEAPAFSTALADGTDVLEFPTLNARSADWVHAAFGGVLTAPGPITQPPSAQPLLVSFDASWTGGAVTVTGTAPGGGVVSEVFAVPGTLPGRTLGSILFASVSEVTAAVAGAGTASVGLGTSRYVSFVRGVGPQRFGLDTTLGLNTDGDGDDALIWGSTGVVWPAQPVKVFGDGLHELPYLESVEWLVGLNTQPDPDTTGYTLGDTTFLWLEFGNRGMAGSSANGAAGIEIGGSGDEVDDIVADINTAVAADPRYGGGAVAAVFADATTPETGPLERYTVGLFGSSYPRGDGRPSVRVHRGPKDAALPVLGFPHRRAVTNSAYAAGATTLAYTNAGGGLPTGVGARLRVGRGLQLAESNLGAIENASGRFADFVSANANFLEHADSVHAAVVDNVAVTAGPFGALALPTTLVVVMDTNWAAGDITVTGTNVTGAAVSEVFATGTDVTRFGSVEFAAVTGITHDGAGAGTGGATVGMALMRDLGGAIWIVPGSASNSNNETLHTIVDVLAADRVRIRHYDPGQVFTNEAASTIDYELWTPGEIVEVETHDVGAGTVDLAGSGLLFARASGVLVEDEAELPMERTSHSVGGSVVVDVDTSMRPTAALPLSDTVALVDGEVPLTAAWGGVVVSGGTAEFTVVSHPFAVGMFVWSEETASGTTWSNAAGDDIPRGVPLEVIATTGTTVEVRYSGSGATDASATGTLYSTRVLPDGWQTNAESGAHIAWDGLLEDYRLVLTRGSADITVAVDVPEAPVGPELRVSAWVAQHNTVGDEDFTLEVSPDDGSSWLAVTGATAVGVAGTLYEVSTGSGSLDPTLVTGVVTLPYDATGMRVRLTHTGNAAGDQISIERLAVTRSWASGTHVGVGTVPRDLRWEHFGEVLYVWNALAPGGGVGALTTTEEGLLGMPEAPDSVPDEPGHIDWSVNAHGLWERFDVSTAANVVGVASGVDWLSATLTNMEIVVGSPDRLSYVRPTVVSEVVGELLNPDAGGVATLDFATTHDGAYPQDPNGTTRLYENDLPVPDTDSGSGVPYAFSAANEIDIGAGFVPAATYTLDYERLLRATTGVLDLGAASSDYLWLVGCVATTRTDLTLGERTIQREVVFGARGEGVLDIASNQDQTTSVLTADDGVEAVAVPDADWEYLGNNRIRINLNVFDADAIYVLEYVGLSNRFARVPTVVYEHRAAASSAGVAAATWGVVSLDDVVDRSLRYHQLRATVTGVGDTRDVRISTLCLRGIALYASPAVGPGLIT